MPEPRLALGGAGSLPRRVRKTKPTKAKEGLARAYTELERARVELRKAEEDNRGELVMELNGRVAYLEELIEELNDAKTK